MNSQNINLRFIDYSVDDDIRPNHELSDFFEIEKCDYLAREGIFLENLGSFFDFLDLNLCISFESLLMYKAISFKSETA